MGVFAVCFCLFLSVICDDTLLEFKKTKNLYARIYYFFFSSGLVGLKKQSFQTKSNKLNFGIGFKKKRKKNQKNSFGVIFPRHFSYLSLFCLDFCKKTLDQFFLITSLFLFLKKFFCHFLCKKQKTNLRRPTKDQSGEETPPRSHFKF